jgi:hypothetical protein
MERQCACVYIYIYTCIYVYMYICICNMYILLITPRRCIRQIHGKKMHLYVCASMTTLKTCHVYVHVDDMVS